MRSASGASSDAAEMVHSLNAGPPSTTEHAHSEGESEVGSRLSYAAVVLTRFRTETEQGHADGGKRDTHVGMNAAYND